MPKKIQHGGLQTFEQIINNCLSHAHSRCIYRIFKYLQTKDNNIFKNAPDDSPFKDYNIIPNDAHKEFFEEFSDLYDDFEINGDINETFMSYIERKVTDADLKKKKIYIEIHEVQNNQKEIYFTILPILTYAYILKIIKGNVIDRINDNVSISMSNNIKEMSFDDDKKKIIINDVDDSDTEYNKENIENLSTHYFYQFNSLFLENEIDNKIEAMKTLNEQIEKFNALISLIPDNLTIRRYYYKNIHTYLNEKKTIFGSFNFSPDLLRKALEQKAANDGTEVPKVLSNPQFGHAVAIYSLKMNDNSYVLEYKDSRDEELAGKYILEFTKEDLNNDFYKGEYVFPIEAWALENMDNESILEEMMVKLDVDGTVINEEIPKNMFEKVNKNFISKLYKEVPIDTKLIEEQIKYLNKKGITDENIKEVLNKYNTIMGYMKNYEIPIDKIETINTIFINKLYNMLPIDTELIEEQIKYLKENGITVKNIENVSIRYSTIVYKRIIGEYVNRKYQIGKNFINIGFTIHQSVLNSYVDTNIDTGNVVVTDKEALEEYHNFYEHVFDENLYNDIFIEVIKLKPSVRQYNTYKTINKKVTEKINKISKFKAPATQGGKRKSKKSRKTKKAKKSRKKNTKKRNRKTRRH